MQLRRRISEYRSTIIFVVLVGVSLVSLASGAPASYIGEAVTTAATVVASPFLKSMKAIENAYGAVTGYVISQGTARREAELLREELGTLRPQLATLEEVKAQNERLRQMLAFQRMARGLQLKPVEVIGRSDMGTLIIDEGSSRGVREGMCAITKDGLIGVVAKVEPYISYVYTLHKAECKVPAVIQGSRVWGMVHGSGSAFSSVCAMHYIGLKDDVRSGDRVVTAESNVYPKGLPIGIVTDVEGDESLLKIAAIVPAADPYRVDELLLVDRAEPSTESLLGDQPGEDRLPDVYTMPQAATIQERLAP